MKLVLLALTAAVPLVTSAGTPSVQHQGDNPFASLTTNRIMSHCARTRATCHEIPGAGVTMEPKK